MIMSRNTSLQIISRHIAGLTLRPVTFSSFSYPSASIGRSPSLIGRFYSTEKSSTSSKQSTNSDSTTESAKSKPKTKSKSKIQSIAPEGTRFKGLNVFKNREDPVALAENEYPDWLWKVLDKPSPDELSEEKKRRLANRKKIREDNFMRKMNK